jgi:hypothetical protein
MDGTAVFLKPFKQPPKGVLPEKDLLDQLLVAIQ